MSKVRVRAFLIMSVLIRLGMVKIEISRPRIILAVRKARRRFSDQRSVVKQ